MISLAHTLNEAVGNPLVDQPRKAIGYNYVEETAEGTFSSQVRDCRPVMGEHAWRDGDRGATNPVSSITTLREGKNVFIVILE